MNSESDLDEQDGQDVATDVLPDDLDLTTLELPYLFPNNNRRRMLGVLYFAIAVVVFLVWIFAGDSPRSNSGFLVAAVALVGLGIYSFVSGHNLNVDELDALGIAGETTGFVVGHASAQLAWRGLTSRPTWSILLYSHEQEPLQRAVVFVDGVNGDVLNSIVEDNPEDWSEYT